MSSLNGIGTIKDSVHSAISGRGGLRRHPIERFGFQGVRSWRNYFESGSKAMADQISLFRAMAAEPDMAVLTDRDLLEMVLFRLLPDCATLPIACALLVRFGNYNDVLGAPTEELLDVDGMDEESVCRLKLFHACVLRGL